MQIINDILENLSVHLITFLYLDNYRELYLPINKRGF